jgi:thioredoxin reductase
VHAVGDITCHPHLASIAAAEGVRAALAIHRSLLPSDRNLG